MVVYAVSKCGGDGYWGAFSLETALYVRAEAAAKAVLTRGDRYALRELWAHTVDGDTIEDIPPTVGRVAKVLKAGGSVETFWYFRNNGRLSRAETSLSVRPMEVK